MYLQLIFTCKLQAEKFVKVMHEEAPGRVKTFHSMTLSMQKRHWPFSSHSLIYFIIMTILTKSLWRGNAAACKYSTWSKDIWQQGEVIDTIYHLYYSKSKGASFHNNLYRLLLILEVGSQYYNAILNAAKYYWHMGQYVELFNIIKMIK